MALGTLQAQEAGKFKARLYIGPGKGEGLGILLGIEPKYLITAKDAVGLRLGTAIILERNATFDIPQYSIESGFITSVITSSITGTFDHYFHNEGEAVAAFVGGGIGLYKSSDVEVEENDNSDLIRRSEDVKIRGQVGLLLRTGFEFRKFRMEGEYNLIPNADIDFLDEGTIGRVNDSYFGLSFGFIIDGGKWRDH